MGTLSRCEVLIPSTCEVNRVFHFDWQKEGGKNMTPYLQNIKHHYILKGQHGDKGMVKHNVSLEIVV